jgi:uncharacterized protein (TIGR03435 family)
VIPRVAVVLLFAGTVAAVIVAQEAPRFSVISIKPSVDNGPGTKIEPRSKSDYSVRKTTLAALLASAYGIPATRIEGAPSWWKTERFDIDARYEPPDPSAAAPAMTVLLQSLLHDRFALVAHTERRNLPVYALRVARNDGRLGAGLRPSTLQCLDVDRPANARDRTTTATNGAPACGAVENPEALIASGMTLEVLARALRPPAERDVVNDTGLTGRWDITLQFAPVGQATGDKPSLFTAVQEQLGLKLEASTAPLDVLVVDSVARPTPN